MKIYTEKICFPLKNKIKKILLETLRETNISQNVSVNIVFVSESEIRQLNKDFRNVDKVTDVLSFPAEDFKAFENVEKFANEYSKDVFLGDVAICKQKAKMQAEEFGHSFKRESCFLALHGFLHLLGFDHENKDDEKIMMDLAEKILKSQKIARGNV